MKRILQSKANRVGVILAFIALVLALGITNPSGALALAEAEADGLSATPSAQSVQERGVTPSTTESTTQEPSSAFDAQSTEKGPNGGSEAAEASSGEVAESPSTGMDAPPSLSSDTPTLPEKGELSTTSETTTDQEQPALTGFVFISGNTKVGSSLVVGVEGAPNGAVLSYQWYRGAEPISGATSTVYTTTSADDGCDISCQVSAVGYSGVLVSGVIRPTSPAPQAFAVYSDDDKSLTFYKRPYLPSEGSIFAGKTATAVYAGIEKSAYEEDAIPWKDYASDVLSVLVADEGIAPISTAHWFLSFVECLSMDLAKLDTSNVVDMTDTFCGCIKLLTLDVSTFNTSKVTNMSYMFAYCELLTELDFSGWDTSNVVDMSVMFIGSTSLKSLDLSMFNTAKVTTMQCMFESCEALTNINMSGWDVSNVTDTMGMFAGCSSLVTLDLSSFDLSRVTIADSMFGMCFNLTTVYASPEVSWLRIANERFAFNHCSRLVGGLGTSWSNEHRDGSYARIDGLDGKPGYFTPKITVSYYDPESDTVSTPVLYVYGITAAESSLEGFLGWALYPNATKPTIAVGERILYDPANIKDLVLYPVRLPALMGAVTISDASSAGTELSSPAKVGDTLVAMVNGVQADALLHCQWYRGEVAIEGATGASYVLVHTDAGQLITCKVTAENYRGTLTSNTLGPIDQVVTVEYWAYTDASPDYYVITNTKTALLSDTFDPTFDPNKDDDSSNDWTGYRTQCWWDENWMESYSISAPQDEAVTLGELARRAEWDGVSPIRVYAEASLRYIEVTYYTNGYSDEYDMETVQLIAWTETPYQNIVWPGYDFLGIMDEGCNYIDETMTCGDILHAVAESYFLDPADIKEYMDSTDTLNLYYDWYYRQYEITFHTMDSSSVMPYGYYDMIDCDSRVVHFDGYEFVGWFTEPDGQGMQVTNGMSYAQFERDETVMKRDLYAYYISVNTETQESHSKVIVNEL